MSPESTFGTRCRLTGLAAAVAAAAWGGCSVTEENYRLLSFFFDGVPEPGARPLGGGLAGGRGVPLGGLVSPASISAHSAYVEQRCNDCHGAGASFGIFAQGFEKLDAGVCLKCHQPVLDEVPLLHGPVAAQECLWCHQPHESPEPNLLAQASPALCLQCHGFQLREAPRMGPHEDLGRDCLECHLGHGGPERYFLRPAAAPGAGEG